MGFRLLTKILHPKGIFLMWFKEILNFSSCILITFNDDGKLLMSFSTDVNSSSSIVLGKLFISCRILPKNIIFIIDSGNFIII